MSNASGLEVLDFAQNGLIGTIPKNLGWLNSLVRLNFDQNNLGNGDVDDLSFPISLANCKKMLKIHDRMICMKMLEGL
ncbi:hypothetical protein NC653_016211 [Populus alba x Populus x berolinensis]|uniref:Uncharacterized protein n=1 Tax=Populus alba x Populus x berolinensis TaxID=444605 RepID=A0AAD6QME6_9ROSI|nr:hypothetical protein NC653_016211 [Populus alba x Populus x berolinensis]